MSVHVKISDRNWILETMARHLSNRLDYLTYDTAADPQAEIQYYLTYSTFRGRVSPVEIAYFTHLEEDPAVQERFFSAAAAVDQCVCMSEIYAGQLMARGIGAVDIIPPGVDLEKFDVKLRIGIVGRTYSTGRKGEALISELMDLPGVEFLFTGEGWPGPALNLPAEDLPDFYRTLDYVLVPSRYEGGPMSAIEALATGVEVIAPAVGWMPELPHISYAANDASDLRRVLTGLVEKKRALRDAVMTRTWDGFADQHDALFTRLLGHRPKLPEGSRGRATGNTTVRLVTHGAEKIAQGGPSTRIPQLANGLSQKGYSVSHEGFGTGQLGGADLYHLFNVATPTTAERAMEGLRSFGRPIVFSPIYLDNRCRSLWAERVPRLLADLVSATPTSAAMEQLKTEAWIMRMCPILQSDTMPLRYHQGVARLVTQADHVIFLSDWERQILAELTGGQIEGTVVPNPVSVEAFRSGDAELFRLQYSVTDFVLCVGRIEPRKNQLMLAAALRGTGIPLVLVGECFDSDYMALITAVPDLELVLTGRLTAGSEILASAFRACRVFCLPSWSEGAPIAALEAAAAGCRMVLSTNSSEMEYFGDRAAYVDPSDLLGMRRVLKEEFDRTWTSGDREALSDFTADKFSVERHTELTAEVYETVLAADALAADAGPLAAPLQEEAPRSVWFDITTLLNHPGRITGITRVELALTRLVRPDDDIRFIAWHSKRDFYFEVDPQYVDFGNATSYQYSLNIKPVENIPKNSAILVQGNAWLRNTDYVRALERLVRGFSLRLALLVHDILPISQPQYFEAEQTSRLEEHLDRLSQIVSIIGADSHATKQDLNSFFDRRRQLPSPIPVIRLGDGLDDGIAESIASDDIPENLALPELLSAGNFALSVGSQLPHKNHVLLYQVWNRLVATMGRATPKLVIVGKAGKQDASDALLPQTRPFVVQLDRVSDAQLKELYGRCLFTLFPSLLEGWGLPVAESLTYGKICIASDNSSIPEIAPDLTDLVDPFDRMAWYTKVRFYSGSAEARERREKQISDQFQPVPWRDTLDQLLNMARTAPTRPIPAATWDFDTTFDFLNREHRSQLAFQEEIGPTGKVTRLTFKLTDCGKQPVVFQFRCSSKRQGIVEVILDGERIETLSFGFGAESVRTIFFPPQSAMTSEKTLELREIGDVGLSLRQFVLGQASMITKADGTLLKSTQDKSLEGGIVPNASAEKSSLRVLATGWYQPEKRYTWSMPQATLEWPLDLASPKRLQFTLKYSLLREGAVAFRVSDDFHVALHGMPDTVNEAVLEIPSCVVAKCGSHLELKIDVPNAAAPAQLFQDASDQRMLGIALRTIKIEEIDRPERKLSSVKPFQGSQNILSRGWYEPEGEHVWSKGSGHLKLDGRIYSKKTICLSILTILEQRVAFFCEGKLLSNQDISPNSVNKIVLNLPECEFEGANIDLVMTPTRRVSPQELGLSEDSRQLGVSLVDFMIMEDKGPNCNESLKPLVENVFLETPAPKVEMGRLKAMFALNRMKKH